MIMIRRPSAIASSMYSRQFFFLGWLGWPIILLDRIAIFPAYR
jgi:hypothetical protein